MDDLFDRIADRPIAPDEIGIAVRERGGRVVEPSMATEVKEHGAAAEERLVIADEV
jgi:hypothetical protein